MGYRLYLLLVEIIVSVGTAVYGWWLTVDKVIETGSPVIAALSEIMPVEYWALVFIWLGSVRLGLLLLAYPQYEKRFLFGRKVCSALIGILWLFTGLDTIRLYGPAAPIYLIIAVQSMVSYAWLSTLSKNIGT
jgi:hypothetical protein